MAHMGCLQVVRPDLWGPLDLLLALAGHISGVRTVTQRGRGLPWAAGLRGFT